MKVLHSLYQSFPNQEGSSIRTKYLLKCLRLNDVENVCITSPFQQGLNKDFDFIDGIKFYRFYRGNFAISQHYKGIFNRFNKFFSLFSFTLECYRVYKTEKPSIVHCHSMFYTVIPFILLKKFGLLNCPIIYEVRSIWFSSNRVSSRNFSFQTSIIQFFERFSYKNSDSIIVINNKLSQHIPSKYQHKIIVIPNAVDDELIVHCKSLSFNGVNSKKFGYIGNLNLYEGLSILPSVTKYVDIQFNIFGGGACYEELICSESPSFRLHGPFAHKEVFNIYKKLDVIVYPRISNFITENVTPLKPLEAIMFKKIIIVSSIGGHVDLLKDFPYIRYFEPCDISSLAYIIESLLKTPLHILEHEVECNFIHLLKNNLWSVNSNKLKSHYNDISNS